MTSLYSGSLYRDSTVPKSRSGEPLVLSGEGEVGEEVFSLEILLPLKNIGNIFSQL